MTLTDAQRAEVTRLGREKGTEYERGTLDAWRRDTTDPADIDAIDRAAARQEKATRKPQANASTEESILG